MADNVTQETDNLGRTNTYTYDIMHRMTSSTNAKGGITTYGYDIRGNQNTVTDALGYTWNYTYDLVDQLTKSVDPEGKATEAVYNLAGQIASITRPGERTTSYTYDGNYNTTIVTDPKGYQYQFTYDKDNRQVGYENPLQETEAIAYDAGSRILGVTDRMGLTESYAYDPHGNVLSVTATNGLVTHFTYDILDRMIGVEMPSGLKTSYTYDEMGNLTSMTDTMLRTTTYTYDIEGNLTGIQDPAGRTEQMTYDIAGRQLSYVSNGKNIIRYDYDTLNDLVEKSYEDADGNEVEEGVLYGYDVTGQRVSMMDRSGESTYEYDGLGRITKVTTGSGETTTYEYGVNDRLSKLTYADGESVSYEYDKNDNLTKVTDRTGAETTYVYDAINRVTEIHRPNSVSTYNTYNARDQIVSMKNICDDCGWVISQYDYTYDDRGFIVGEDAVESLYGYAWDDKHDGKHENWHDDNYPHGDKHTNKHDKDGEYNFQIIETKRSFTYDADGKLLTVSEDEDRQGHYDYEMTYDDMGNRTSYTKSRNGEVVESGEYTYNLSNQLVSAKLYDGKKHTTMEYTYDADGNLIAEDGTIGTDKVEKDYIYTVENRLKAVYDGDDLLVAMAYDGDGNRIFQLNYNLHTDDDWKGNSGNGNGNNKDNSGSGKSLWSMIVDFFTGGDEEESIAETAEAETMAEAESTERMNPEATPSTFKLNDNGNNGNNGNGGNGNHYGWESGDGEDPEPEDPDAGSTDEGENGSGNTNNTGGSQNQSGILFPEEGEVSELEDELIGMIKTSGHEKNYELIEYVNDVNRENAEVLMELNINGKMDTAYSYGNERLTVERFDGWTGYYTYDPRGSVSGVTGSDGYLWQSYRYDPFGDISFGKPQYNNVYAYNAESFNPNLDTIYLRARYYYTSTANFLSEDTYLGDISDPLTLNRYNYALSSYLNYKDPSGHDVMSPEDLKDPYRGSNQNSLISLKDINKLITSFKQKVSEVVETAAKYVNEKITDALKSLLNSAQDLCKNLDCGIATVAYNMILGAGYAVVENVILEPSGVIGEIIGTMDSNDREKALRDIEEWVIENGATDARYFYFGKVISTVLQTAYAVSQIPKIISKLGPALSGLSTAFSSGSSVKIMDGVMALAGGIGISVEEAQSLVDVIGAGAAGVVFAFGNAAGMDDAAKLVKAFKEGDSETKRVYEPSPKHNPQGGWGSENPIPNNEVGQELLDTAYSSSKNKQLYNIYEGDIIKFQPDSSSGKWHAYKVSNTAKEVPTDVYKKMLNDGLITKTDYNKLIRNNWY